MRRPAGESPCSTTLRRLHVFGKVAGVRIAQTAVGVRRKDAGLALHYRGRLARKGARSRGDLMVGLYHRRVGLDHARPGLDNEAKVEGAAMHQSPLVLEADGADLAVLGVTKDDVAGVVGVFKEAAEGVAAAVGGVCGLLGGCRKREAQQYPA